MIVLDDIYSSIDKKNTKKIRRHDLDWLRIILFGLLIPFHISIGIYWTTYGEQINPNLENPERSGLLDYSEDEQDAAINLYTQESVDPTSMFLHWMHQWRLAALFMISGFGTAFAFKNRKWQEFIKERFFRLIIPMFFGVWTVGFVGSVILGDIETDVEGLISGFIWVILLSLFFWVPVLGKILSLGHLWFIWNLFQYSILLTPIFHYINTKPDRKIAKLIKSTFSLPNGLGIFLIFPLFLTFTEILFKPWMVGFLGSGYQWFWYFLFFLFGYLCIISKDRYYAIIEKRRITISIITIILTLAFIWLRIEQYDSGIPYVDGGWISFDIIHNSKTIFACLIHSFHSWFWCLTIFSWGAHILNNPSHRLTYLNQGVYTFYIVHMPLTYLSLLISSELGITNLFAVIFCTFFVAINCWLFFEIAKRNKITRFLFGIKEPKNVIK